MPNGHGVGAKVPKCSGRRCGAGGLADLGHVFARHAELRILASEDILPVLHFGLNLERKRSETDHLKSD